MKPEIMYSFYETPAGWLGIGCTADAVVMLRITAAKPAYPDQPTALSDRTAAEVHEYLAGERRTFSVPVTIGGTAFRQACYRAVMQIPYGETRSYGEIAAAVGRPKAARAVGAAMAQNPLWLIVPCHRVCGADGSLTGYAGGLPLKQRLLQMELHEGRRQKGEAARRNHT